jgi:bifunctional N-acetylglucosamine-1-phosphate-uridyltransferase/glucosamine-1-phosphate-acetyltransferase GlmU-like protein
VTGNNEVVALSLSAGKGKRMESDLTKVLHLLGGRPLVHYVMDADRDRDIPLLEKERSYARG